MTALHRQADHFCPFEVMPVKDSVNRAKGDSCEMLLDSGPLISGSLCISLCIAQSFFPPPLAIFLPLLLIPPKLPFIHILLSTSLSHCAIVAWSLLYPAAVKTPRLFNSGVHHSIQLNSQQRVSDCSSFIRGFLQSHIS